MWLRVGIKQDYAVVSQPAWNSRKKITNRTEATMNLKYILLAAGAYYLFNQNKVQAAPKAFVPDMVLPPFILFVRQR